MTPRLHLAAVALAAAALVPALAPAQQDAPNAKDHPLLTRYPNSHITEYEKNYNAVEFAVGTQGGQPKRQPVEGDATVIRYFHNTPEKQPNVVSCETRKRRHKIWYGQIPQPQISKNNTRCFT